MPAGARDPYAVLGVGRAASDEELRGTYRRLVRLHHPDHNNGSRESTVRFQEIQEAYARIVADRRVGPSYTRRTTGRSSTPPPPRPPAGDPDIDERLRAMEDDLRAAKAAQAEAARAAREAAARAAGACESGRRPSDEELGYVRTDDSVAKILSDALEALADRFDKTAKPVVKRIEDLIDEL